MVSLVFTKVSKHVLAQWERVQERFFERYYGVKTGGAFDTGQLGFDALLGEEGASDAGGYQAIAYKKLHLALKQLPQKTLKGGFVDYGCGKGRAVVVAARHGFSRVTGVELSPELAEAAAQNLVATGLTSIAEIVQIDATAYEPPRESSVAFLYNPFFGQTLVAVIEQLEQSLLAYPREFYLVYIFPEWVDDVFESLDRWKLEVEHRLNSSDRETMRVYRFKA